MSKKNQSGSAPQPTRIRRNVEDFGDPYLPRLDPGEVAVCERCHAIFERRRWRFDEDAFARLQADREVRRVECPACRKIRDRYPEGEVVLTGAFADSHRDELMNLIRNEEHRAMGLNPLERIVAIETDADGLHVTTTNEKLAQRIGRALERAYHGDAEYRWSDDTKFLRVTWRRD